MQYIPIPHMICPVHPYTPWKLPSTCPFSLCIAQYMPILPVGCSVYSHTPCGCPVHPYTPCGFCQYIPILYVDCPIHPHTLCTLSNISPILLMDYSIHPLFLPVDYSFLHIQLTRLLMLSSLVMLGFRLHKVSIVWFYFIYGQLGAE